jgi:hypothetical protein
MDRNKTLLLFIVLLLLSGSALPDSLTIRGDASDCDASFINQYNNQLNYGNTNSLEIGDAFSGARFSYTILKFTQLADTMQAYAPATWDSARLAVVVLDATGLDPGTSVPDSIMSTLNKGTAAWCEGTGTGDGTGGVTWDSAIARGTADACGDSADWTDGGDYSATEEPAGATNDTVYLVGGELSQYDTIYYSISGATIADTLGDYYTLFIIAARVADGDDASSTALLDVAQDGYATADYRPYLELFYTPTSGATKNIGAADLGAVEL